MLVKLGEAVSITPSDIQPVENVLADDDILNRFKKFAAELKVIAPKANDFLYFTAVMMHAAEASLLDDNGEIKKDANGSPIEASWEEKGEGLVWKCSEPNIKPYKNVNNDIFPEKELKKAYKSWVGRPLCLDHQSDSVDMVRGVIVDTYYDQKNKRVIALCALDKKNYPDLARKVSSGYATSVSMGTGVGRAVCFDCHAVARIPADFCEHMKNKSCYGEVNLDLSPIELSLVVSGADPKATVKDVIAKDLNNAADSISQYMENKIKTGNIGADELKSIKEDLSKLSDKVSKLLEENEKDSNNLTDGAPYGASSGIYDMKEGETSPTNQPFSPPEPIPTYATQLQDMHKKVAKLEEDFNVLKAMNNKQNSSEDNMSDNINKKSYFQGGGGVNEPTPGKPKYEKEDYQTNRDKQDKQMVGQKPFPDVGPVDGMHPGYDSYGNEADRKRRLQRLADVQERKMRRQAAIKQAKESLEKKRAYYQGGGGVNEPTPGKPKYEKEDYQTNRDKQDKQMTGQAPFPDVGDVEGLHPSPASADEKDELKRKQMLARANLKARFVKAADIEGNHDKGESRWNVYAGNNLILTATVDEITGGRSEALYESIASEPFGKNLLQKIRSEGFNKVKSILKQGQQQADAEVPGPGRPMDEGSPKADVPAGDLGAPEGMEEPGLEDLESPEGAGAPEDQVQELAEQVRDVAEEAAKRADDLIEAVKALEEEAPQLESVPEASEEEILSTEASSVSELQKIRKTLSSNLIPGMRESVGDLRSHLSELKTVHQAYKENYGEFDEKRKHYFNSIVSQAVNDAKNTVSEADRLLSAFVKYAHATNTLMKKATAEYKNKKQAQSKDPEGKDLPVKDPAKDYMTTDVKPGEIKGEDVELSEEGKEVLGPLADPETYEVPEEAEFNDPLADENKADVEFPEEKITPKEHYEDKKEYSEEGKKEEYDEKQPMDKDPMYNPLLDPKTYENMPETHWEMDEHSANDGMAVSLPQGTKVQDLQKLPPGTTVSSKKDLNTKEGRTAWRKELLKKAQKGLKWEPTLDKAHPDGGTSTQLDNKPAENYERVEDLKESHEKHMDVATAPPKVRKQAEQINELVKSGELSKDDVDQLTSYGVDQAAVDYWKQFWGEAKDQESSEFAQDLVKEYAQKKQAQALEEREVRIKRAYDLAYEMRDKGVIEPSQLKEQVDEILKMNDEGYEGLKRIVARQSKMEKKAMPTVGMMSSGDIMLPGAESQQQENNSDLASQLSKIFANKRY